MPVDDVAAFVSNADMSTVERRVSRVARRARNVSFHSEENQTSIAHIDTIEHASNKHLHLHLGRHLYLHLHFRHLMQIYEHWLLGAGAPRSVRLKMKAKM